MQMGKKAFKGCKERKEARSKSCKAKALCGAESVCPRSSPSWNNMKSFLDPGRGFPALTSTSENGLPFLASDEGGSPF